MTPNTPLKIFIADDEVFYLNILEQHIRNLGYEDISSFGDGHTCLKKIQENPDIVFLDYSMGELSGYDVLKKIKRYNPNIYVVIISGQDEIKPAIDSLKHGAFDYIQKDNKEEEKISKVLDRIIEVKDLLERSKPTLLKSIFKFL